MRDSDPMRPAEVAGATARREIELKLAINRAETLDALMQLRTLTDRFRVRDGHLVHLVDTYVDTPDYALIRAGYVLRIRREDGVTKISVKGLERTGLAAVHERFELEGVVDGEAPLRMEAWPEAVRASVAALVGPEPRFQALCGIEHTRHVSQVQRAVEQASAVDGEIEIGELCVERVQVVHLEGPGGERARVTALRFNELEFELADPGQLADFEEVSCLLTDLGGLTPVADSKLERALRAVAAHPLAATTDLLGIDPSMSMAEAGRLYLRTQLVEMLLNEAGVRRGVDPEYVHDMRVATRRSRAAARLFRAHFDRAAVRPFFKNLRRTGRLLGKVRDLDVGILGLEDYAGSASPGEQVQIRGVAESWEISRQAARGRLLEWLHSPRYRRFIADYDCFLRAPGAGVAERPGSSRRPTSDRVRHVLPLEILARFATVRGYEVALEHMDTVRDDVLHRLRVDLKRLRYALELVSHRSGKPGRRTLRRLRSLQDHLGALNDAVVARSRLRAQIEEGLDPRSVAGYLARTEEMIRDLRATLPPEWNELLSDRSRRQLMLAVSKL